MEKTLKPIKELLYHCKVGTMVKNEESICISCMQPAEHTVIRKATFNNKKESTIDVNGLNGLSVNAFLY